MPAVDLLALDPDGHPSLVLLKAAIVGLAEEAERQGIAYEAFTITVNVEGDGQAVASHPSDPANACAEFFCAFQHIAKQQFGIVVDVPDVIPTEVRTGIERIGARDRQQRRRRDVRTQRPRGKRGRGRRGA